jgi:hypothetical protein
MEECMSTNPTVSRISLVDPENAPQPIKDALSRLPVINVFRALANAESLYPYFSAYMLQLFRPMELDKALERMIVLHVVKRSECLYAYGRTERDRTQKLPGVGMRVDYKGEVFQVMARPYNLDATYGDLGRCL